MDPQVQHQLMIWGGALPAGLSIVLLLIFWSIHTRKAMWTDDDSAEETGEGIVARSGPVWLLPVLIAVGFIGAVSAQFPSFQWWPNDNSYRLPHAMILIGVLGAAEGVFRVPTLLGIVLRTGVFAGVFWLLASGYRSSEAVFADDWAYFGWWGIAALIPALLATLHEQSSEKVPGWVDAGCWMLVLGGMMPTLFFNGNATGSTVLPGVLAVLGPAAVVGLICKPLTLSRGAVTALIGVVLVVMIGSCVHSELRSLPAAILLVGAVCTGLIQFDGKSVFKYILVRAGIAALLLGGAAALSYHHHDLIENGGAESGEYDPYADYSE